MNPKIDINKAIQWVVHQVESVDGVNKVWPYFRRIKNGSELIRDFGTGEKDLHRGEKTRGWHVVYSHSYREANTASFGGAFNRVYSFEISNYWSEYENGASFLDLIQHVTLFIELFEKKHYNHRNVESFQIHKFTQQPTRDHLWPLVGGKLHHYSHFELEIKRREQV